ncbi:MAG: hypothetical protein L6R38_008945 [Xanthoria sp. 2 TBL-2021]|nr:MAG: hypothetical protein L6R38_008945 [Xanthoria sp. 2 TBL-2021]
MPLQVTARRRGQSNAETATGRPIRLEDQRIIAKMNSNNLNDDDMRRCYENPGRAAQIYKERRQRLAKQVQERIDRIDKARNDGDEALRAKETHMKILEITAEQNFIKKLLEAGFDVLTPNIKVARKGKVVEASDRKTRFGGKARPFIGERLEGEPLTTTARSKKRKSGEAYPSSPSTPPAKQARRATPSPSPATAERNRRSVLPSPEEMRPAPPAPVVWNENFSWNQPVGMGPGIVEDREPDPIYEVKRINCHFRVRE